ncbi:MAG: tripartite tricarboxylate transporter substrate binding protein [Rhodoferax sp.]|nr:tripartite tricarboxylate transporter substrate binding protein [Rhodoferax sp.]
MTLAKRFVPALLTAAMAAVTFTAASLAMAQEPASAWPSHPVKVIVPGTPGDGADLAGRIIGIKLQERLGQPFIIDNKPGAGAIIGTEAGKNAAADGYTFLIGTAGSHAINQAVYAKLPYHPLRDFEPVLLINKTPNVCVINPGIPARSLAEFVALAKKSPGQYSFSSGGNGSSAHLTGEYLKLVAGIDMLHVPYKGASPAVNDVVAGQVSMFCGNLPPAIPHIRSGALRALGVTTLQRNTELPDVPTIAETYPGFESVAWFGYFAPRGTPPDILAKFYTELAAVMKMPDVRDKLIAQGTDPVASPPAEFRKFIEGEIDKWTKVARAAKVQL